LLFQGKILSAQVVQIYTEFTSALSTFSKLKFDLLDLNSKDLQIESSRFQSKITDLDRRIGTVLCQSFDDCPSLYSCFRLLETFSGLLYRPTIQKDFELKYYEILKMFSTDLDDVSIIFNQFKNAPPIHYNMAPVTGAIAWIHELKERVSKSMDKLKGV
jgi:dynein heavy chain